VVSAEAIALGWSFFGPLIDGMLSAMEAFTNAELDTVARFLRAMADAAANTPRRSPPLAAPGRR
jgi:hypothetical protein